MISTRTALAVLALITASAPAYAAVTISTDPTHNMTCSGGVCAPTATDAVLNVNDLESLLASGNVKVTTTGSGVQANDIAIRAALGWSMSSMLALDAYHSISIYKPVLVTGTGGISIVANDGGIDGVFAVRWSGQITFENPLSTLLINGTSYTLVGDIKSLAAAIAVNSSGAYALAANYDASADGTYSSAPIPTTFTGAFDGLGHVISHLAINAKQNAVGFFAQITSPGTVSHINLSGLQIVATDAGSAGGLAASTTGTLFEDSATGSITATDSGRIGGLAGANSCGGVIRSSFAHVNVSYSTSKGLHSYAGGLVGYNSACSDHDPILIANSYATGDVAGNRGVACGLVGNLWGGSIAMSYATGNVRCRGCNGGGLVGRVDPTDFAASVEDSYARGNVADGSNTRVGGLIGEVEFGTRSASVSASFATGAITAEKNSFVGGFVGTDTSSGSMTNCYWDTDTSGITNLSQGAGYPANDPGISGLTTAQLRSGLPAGFDSLVWAEQKGINHGLPYLIKNPPPK